MRTNMVIVCVMDYFAYFAPFVAIPDLEIHFDYVLRVLYALP